VNNMYIPNIDDLVIAIAFFIIGIIFIVVYYIKEPGVVAKYIIWLGSWHPFGRNKKQLFIGTIIFWILSFSIFLSSINNNCANLNKYSLNFKDQHILYALIGGIIIFILTVSIYIWKYKNR